MSTNPKTIAYEEMMEAFSKQFINLMTIVIPKEEGIWQRLIERTNEVKDFIASSYISQLKAEIKRLKKEIDTRDFTGKKWPKSTQPKQNGWNLAIQAEIELIQEAIKEIKALQE